MFYDKNRLRRCMEKLAKICDERDCIGYDRTLSHHLMLIMNDVCEAADANARAEYALMQQFTDSTANFDKRYVDFVMNTVEERLAIIIIRCMHTANAMQVQIVDGYELADNLLIAFPDQHKSFVENAWQLSKCINGGPIIKRSMFMKLLNIIRFVELWSSMLHFDIWQYVELRLQYDERNESNVY